MSNWPTAAKSNSASRPWRRYTRAYTGTGWTEGKKHDNIRSVLGTFSSRFYFYTFADREISKAGDVAGKRLSAGSTGSTPSLFSKRVFEVLGGAPSAYITGSFADLNNQLRDGLVDAGFIVSGLPHPAVTELSVRREMTVFSFDAAERKKIQESYPYLKDCVIPADTYKGQTADVESLCLWNAIITHKDVSEEMVYDLTRTVLENLPTLVDGPQVGYPDECGERGRSGDPPAQGRGALLRREGIDDPRRREARRLIAFARSALEPEGRHGPSLTPCRPDGRTGRVESSRRGWRSGTMTPGPSSPRG